LDVLSQFAVFLVRLTDLFRRQSKCEDEQTHDQHGNFATMLALQNMIEQRGLARAEKSGHDRNWNRRRLLMVDSVGTKFSIMR
jgi:hypothetical protein